LVVEGLPGGVTTMNEQPGQLGAVEDLDASVDALMQDIESSSERVHRGVKAVAEGEDDFADFAGPEAIVAAEAGVEGVGGVAAGAEAPDEVPASKAALDEILNAASAELNAGALEASAEQVLSAPELGGVEAKEIEASGTDPVESGPSGAGPSGDEPSGAGTGEPEAPAPAAVPAAIEEIDADFASPEQLTQSEAAVDAAKQAELEARASQPPVGDIEALDKALAEGAEGMIERSRAPEPAAAEPVAEPAAGTGPGAGSGGGAGVEATSESRVAVAAATVAAASVTAAAARGPEPAVAPADEPRTRGVGERVGSGMGVVLGPLGRVATVALRPLSAAHERLGEQTRQTLGYLAIMNVFFASVVWFMVLRPRPEPTVTYDVRSIYLSEQAAREAERAKAAEAAKAKKDDGHGAAKKDEKKPAKKDDKKGAAKKDDHGGH
jgi:hypothetical protein